MVRFKFITLLILFAVQGLHAQNQANIWYFGMMAGIDFNSGSPVALLDGQVDTNEGVASIADAAGNLLFYTDGINVWNKDHLMMPNGFGLLGNISSAQSAIIVPKPQSSSIYYIFTVDEKGFAGGFNFSEVNMALNGGLGDITANKNVPLLAQSTEQVTAVAHANGTDVWVITHDMGNSQFRAFRVTPSGVATVPVSSSAGTALNNSELDAIGYMKASPDGQNIAMGNYESGARLFTFNASNGQVSNGIALSVTGRTYGVEFSPSGRLLYISNEETADVLQYDLDAADIPASAVEITGDDGAFFSGGALQLAPDGKIYYSCSTATALSVINAPDSIGTACSYTANAIDLGGRMCTYGLPPFIQSWFLLSIKAEHLCFGDATQFDVDANVLPDSVAWEFGDGAVSNQLSVSHTYAAAGTYTVKMSATRLGLTRIHTRDIVIEALPVANQPADMALCDAGDDGQEVFNLTQQNAQVLGAQPAADFTVTYHITLQDAQDGANALPAGFTNTANPQVIFVRVTSQTGCHAEASFRLIVRPEPVIEIEEEYTLCEGGMVTLTAPDGFDGYLWSTGAVTRSIHAVAAGQYSVTVFKDNGDSICESTKDLTVNLSAKPVITKIAISDWTDDQNSISILAEGPGDYEYSIDGIHYQDSPVFNGLDSGLYTMYARDKNGCGLATDEVFLLTYPKFFTPNGDGENETWRIKYAYFESNMLVHIFDRYGKLITSFKGLGAGWDGKLNGQKLPATDYWFVVQRQDGKEFKGHFAMLR
jgi:gliding motility-associated-like protein